MTANLKMKAVFLDRDGVINEFPGYFKYVTSWDDFHFLPNVAQSLKKLTANGFKIFIISNQAGVGKGLYTKQTLDLITNNMLKGLGAEVKIEGVYYCTHISDEGCNCRKPKTGLIHAALAGINKKKDDLDLNNSYFVGDTIRDIDTGKAAGIKTILVFSGREKPEGSASWLTQPDFTANDLSEAVEIILRNVLIKQ